MREVAEAKLGPARALARPGRRVRGPGRRRRAGGDRRGHRARGHGRDRRRVGALPCRRHGRRGGAHPGDRERGARRAARPLGGRRAGAAPAGRRARRSASTVRAIGAIGPGLLVLLGVGHGDDEATADALARRICELRIFRDDEGRTNRSLLDAGGEALVVSQFTLYADTRRGRRPGFTDAADPELARALWRRVAAGIEAQGVRVGAGRVRRGDGGRARERRPVHDLARYRRLTLRGPS